MLKRMAANTTSDGAAAAAAAAATGGGEGGGGVLDGGRAWAAGGGTTVPTECQHSLDAHSSEANDVAYAPSGAYLATGAADGTVRLWEAGTGRVRGTLRVGHGATSGGTPAIMAVDCAGDRVAAGCNDRTFHVWNARTQRLAHAVPAHAASAKLYALKLVSGGATVVTGGSDRAIKRWDLGSTSCKCVATLRAPSACLALAESGHGGADGQLASGHQDGVLRLWDSRDPGRPNDVPDVHGGMAVTSVAFSPRDPVYCLSNGRDNALHVVDMRTLSVVTSLRHPSFRCASNWARACWSPDGAMAAAGGLDGAVYVWDVSCEAFKATLQNAQKAAVSSVAWSPGAKGWQQLACVDKGGQLCLWT